MLRDKHISSARGGFKLHVNHLTLCPANAEIKWSYQAVSLCRHLWFAFQKGDSIQSSRSFLWNNNARNIVSIFLLTWNHEQVLYYFLIAQFHVRCLIPEEQGRYESWKKRRELRFCKLFEYMDTHSITTCGNNIKHTYLHVLGLLWTHESPLG